MIRRSLALRRRLTTAVSLALFSVAFAPAAAAADCARPPPVACRVAVCFAGLGAALDCSSPPAWDSVSVSALVAGGSMPAYVTS